MTYYFLRDGFGCPQSPKSDNDGFFLLSSFTGFACDIGNLEKVWISVSFEVIANCIQCMIGRLTDYFITCNTLLTRPNKVNTAVRVFSYFLSV